MENIDWIVMAYAVVAFLIIGVGLSWVILICHSIFAPHGKCVIRINSDPDLTKTVEAGILTRLFFSCIKKIVKFKLKNRFSAKAKTDSSR